MAVSRSALSSGNLSDFELALVRELNLHAKSLGSSKGTLRALLGILVGSNRVHHAPTEVISEQEIAFDPKILWLGRPVARTLVVRMGRMMQLDKDKADEIVEQAERVGAILEQVHRT